MLNSALSRFEKRGNQRVGRFESSATQAKWHNRIDRLQLVQVIHPQIDFGRTDISVAKPQRHLTDVSSSFEYCEGAAMSKLMGRYRAAIQGRATLPCRTDVFVEDVFETCPGIAVPSAFTN